jgi:hypothetical protein
MEKSSEVIDQFIPIPIPIPDSTQNPNPAEDTKLRPANTAIATRENQPHPAMPQEEEKDVPAFASGVVLGSTEMSDAPAMRTESGPGPEPKPEPEMAGALRQAEDKEGRGKEEGPTMTMTMAITPTMGPTMAAIAAGTGAKKAIDFMDILDYARLHANPKSLLLGLDMDEARRSSNVIGMLPNASSTRSR